MAAAVRGIHNRLDNAAFYTETIVTDPVLNRLLTRFIGYGPFAGDEWTCNAIPAMAHVITYVRYRRSGTDDPDLIKVRAGAIAECLGPGLSDDRYFARDEAVSRIRKIGTWLRNHMADLTELTTATVANYPATIAMARMPGSRLGIAPALIADDYPDIEPNSEDVSLHGAIMLIYHAAAQGTDWINNYPLSSLLHLHMAVAKQGNVTTRFISKVRQGVMADLQIQVDVSPLLISTFWNTFRSGIDETNVRDLFTHWSTWIPAAALRMRLIIQQTAMTGLTVLACIGKAMILHPSFSWDWLAWRLPREMEAYRAAVQAVGNNTYYGYKRDLGNVSSTHYKTVGYVAYQLLLKANGMQTLSGYKGWPRNVPADIITKVDQYVDGRSVEEPSEEDLGEAQVVVAAIRETVTDAENAAVYA